MIHLTLPGIRNKVRQILSSGPTTGITTAPRVTLTRATNATAFLRYSALLETDTQPFPDHAAIAKHRYDAWYTTPNNIHWNVGNLGRAAFHHYASKVKILF